MFEIDIARRYLVSPREDKGISMITWISIIGVALGVIALVVATSIMNGFSHNLQKSVSGSLPNITVYEVFGTLANYESLLDKLSENKEVTGGAPFIFKEALLKGQGKPKGSFIRGIDPSREPSVTDISFFLRNEVYPENTLEEEDQQKVATQILKDLNLDNKKEGRLNQIVLGAALAKELGVFKGDKVKLISSASRITPVGKVPKIIKLKVAGIFESGIPTYDGVLSFIDYRLAQKLFNMKGQVNGLGLKIKNAEKAPQVADVLKNDFGEFLIENWADENKNLFHVMKLEKLALFIILTLIIVVAAFNIISSLVMLVMEKSREIAILKSLGAKDQSIRKIFIYQGVFIGSLGTVVGILMGLGICFVLANFNFIEIPPGVYPGGNKVPVMVEPFDIIMIAVSSFLICFLVTLYPSHKAMKLNPIEALRYE